jgi:disulfide bond formation protein DsbB
MYPITIISLVSAIFSVYKPKLVNNINSAVIALILSIIGLFVSGYHYLLQKTDIFGSFETCSAAFPCGAEQINWFGFITIPLQAFTAFLLIGLLSAYFIFREVNRD